MRLFVATESLEGEGDFSFTLPGELLHFPPVVCCASGCGCDRAMAGFVSHKATTCFVVRDLDIDFDTYSELLFDTLKQAGWATDAADDRAWVRDWATEHLAVASNLPVETPLRFRGGEVVVREVEGSA
jgi:hypothetical protein